MAQYSRLSAAAVSTGTTSGSPALVLLHGYTQNGQSWAPVLQALPPVRALAPDAPGHGGSGALRADLWATAGLLADLVDGPCTWVGYSMGGRTALHVAMAHPQKVGRLVLISTTAGIAGRAARQERLEADERLARRIEAGGDEGLAAFIDDWLAQPLFATLGRAEADVTSRLTNTAAGLAASLRLAGAGAQEPLWDRLPELGRAHLPVLVVTGELDRRYCEHATAMATAIGPTATTAVVPGAGHACHLERPGAVATLIARFAGLA